MGGPQSPVVPTWSVFSIIPPTVATGFSTFLSHHCIVLGRNTHLCLYVYACSIYIYINTYIPVHHICIVFYDPKSPHSFFFRVTFTTVFSCRFWGKNPKTSPTAKKKSPAAPIGQLGHVPHAVKNPTQPWKWDMTRLRVFRWFRSGPVAAMACFESEENQGFLLPYVFLMALG